MRHPFVSVQPLHDVGDLLGGGVVEFEGGVVGLWWVVLYLVVYVGNVAGCFLSDVDVVVVECVRDVCGVCECFVFVCECGG